jgi:1,4-dihydroxy-2-naphthoate octaprenyltransferase
VKKTSNWRIWLAGARPRTLLLALAPVILGFAAVFTTEAEPDPLRTALALLVALALQVGVNFANDYSDGIRGTDTNRKGPLRLTASGSARPKSVRTAAFLAFGVAALAGVALVLLTQQWWLLGVGAVAILAAWLYTGGKHPYGYFGLGEAVAFIFFGLVATIGTSYVSTLDLVPLSVPLGAAAGSFAAAVLLVNNIRDLETDSASQKRTLAVLLGSQRARVLFLMLIWAPMIAVLLLSNLYPAVTLGWGALLLVIPSTVIVGYAKSAAEYNLVLKLTAFASLAFAVLLGLGLSLPAL